METLKDTGPCYGCGEPVPDDEAHTVYRYGTTLMCDTCRTETLAEVKRQAVSVLGDIEWVASALRKVVEGTADKHDRSTLEDWIGGNYTRELMVGGEVDLPFLFGEQERIAAVPT